MLAIWGFGLMGLFWLLVPFIDRRPEERLLDDNLLAPITAFANDIHALGGFIFGMAMNWGGGGAAGVWYKLGAGNIGAFIAIIGLCLGYIAAEVGALKTLRLFIQSVNFDAMTLGTLLDLSFWSMGVPLALLLFLLLKTARGNPEQGWSWIKTGVVVGAIGVVAWLASSATGRFFGMAVMPGSRDVFDLPLTGRWETLNWDFFFVLGMPLGGFFSVSRHGKFSWSTLSGSKALSGAALWKLAAGGFVLGVSASLAGGCTVSHGLTGIPVLSIGSIVFTIFAMLGAWTGVYMQKVSERIMQK